MAALTFQAHANYMTWSIDFGYTLIMGLARSQGLEKIYISGTKLSPKYAMAWMFRIRFIAKREMRY